VKRDPDINGRYVATEIIDWEFSGFYPAYYEYTVLTRTLSVVDEDDWYLYLPGSISPSQFPVRWLVDRIWEIHHWTTYIAQTGPGNQETPLPYEIPRQMTRCWTSLSMVWNCSRIKKLRIKSSKEVHLINGFEGEFGCSFKIIHRYQ
jgi:hypothetical protein